MFLFDTGSIILTNRDGQKVRAGSLNGVSLDLNISLGEVGSQFKHPIKFVGGKSKWVGRAKAAQFNGALFSDLFFDVASTTGSTILNEQVATVPASPYQVQASPATGFADYGVTSAALVPLLAGVDYTVTAGGLYTFTAAQAGLAVRLRYTTTLTTGKTLMLTNQFQGIIPTFGVLLSGKYGSKQLVASLPQCASSKLGLSLVLEDWTTADFDFTAQSDNGLNIGYISLSE